MVNLTLQVILCGLATTFAIELISLAAEMIASKTTIYAVLSLPISGGFLYAFIEPDKRFFVLVPAIAFIATVLNKWLNKPIQIQQRLPRL